MTSLSWIKRVTWTIARLIMRSGHHRLHRQLTETSWWKCSCGMISQKRTWCAHTWSRSRTRGCQSVREGSGETATLWALLESLAKTPRAMTLQTAYFWPASTSKAWFQSGLLTSHVKVPLLLGLQTLKELAIILEMASTTSSLQMLKTGSTAFENRFITQKLII